MSRLVKITRDGSERVVDLLSEPAGDGTQAATLYGWGTPTHAEEFTAPLTEYVDGTGWIVFSSGGFGDSQYTASRVTVTGGSLVLDGQGDGTTGALGLWPGQLYGRWETRIRIPYGDADYHPVALLWPAAEDWPVGGEVDFYETTAGPGRVRVGFNLHYSAEDQQSQGGTYADGRGWHNYAVEWTATHIKGYLDGQLWFVETDPTRLPPRAMRVGVQLDWMGTTGATTAPARMEIAWLRVYSAS